MVSSIMLADNHHQPVLIVWHHLFLISIQSLSWELPLFPSHFFFSQTKMDTGVLGCQAVLLLLPAYCLSCDRIKSLSKKLGLLLSCAGSVALDGFMGGV